MTATGRERTPADVAYAALLEVGRHDLANLIVWFYDDGAAGDGIGYLELLDDVDDDQLVPEHAALADDRRRWLPRPLSAADLELVDRAEAMAREYARRVARLEAAR